MPVILPAERKSTKARLFLALIYALLSLGGITMIWPFLVMLSASFTGPYDYHRYSPVVRALWDRPDRFMRHISSSFDRFPLDIYPDAPEQWGSWIVISRDEEGCRSFASQQLAAIDDPQTFARWQRAAADYASFNLDYDPLNSICNYDSRHIASFVRNHFEELVRADDPSGYALMLPAARRDAALTLLNKEWLIRYRSFFGIRMVAENARRSIMPAGTIRWIIRNMIFFRNSRKPTESSNLKPVVRDGAVSVLEMEEKQRRTGRLLSSTHPPFHL